MEISKEIADKIWCNGNVYTVNDNQKWGEAIAIFDKKILAIGSNKDVLELKGPNTEVIDINGGMVMPGFIDSHAHPTWGGTELLYKVNLFDCKCIPDYEQEIRTFIGKNPQSEFIQGVGWVNPHFEETGPSKDILDRISNEIPMVFDSADHHSIWANSKAMELAGVNRDTQSPEGGVIERDHTTGELLGTFRETAQDLIKKIIPQYTKEEYKAGILEYQKVMSAYGITMSHDAIVEPDSPAHEAYLELDRDGKLLFKMTAAFASSIDNPMKDAEKYGDLSRISKGGMFSAEHVKFFLDGVVEASTAYLKEPYSNDPEFSGTALWGDKALKDLLIEIDKQGLTPHFHVIGDMAIDQMLTALEYVAEKNGEKERRPIAAHVQILDAHDLPRMVKMNVHVSANPYWFVKEAGYYYKLEEPYLGVERASKEYPMKSLMDAGLVVASASDFSVTPVPKPLRGIQMGVTRCFPEMDINDPMCVLGEEERVTIEEMIQTFTINGAKIAKKENETGNLEVGKLADLVILEKNILEVPVNEIAFVKVIETVSEGKTIYTSNGSKC